MAENSSFDLQAAITTALTGDAGLVALMGGTKVYDHVPSHAPYPYLTFGQSLAREWGSAESEGEEHILTLHVWSQGGSREQAHAIMAAVRRVLHDATLALTDHRLVNIRQEFADARREPEREGWHGILRYRAITEPR